MRIHNWIAAIATALVLTACGGGGGNAGTSPLVPSTPDGGVPAIPAKTVEISTSANQIGSAGQTALITAVVKDANNSSIPSAAIAFSVDTGTLTSAATTTGPDGSATATLSAGTNKAARTLVVTATSGSATASVRVTVVATQQTIELITDNVQIGTGGDVATITALVKNENNVSVGGATVAFSTDSGTLAGVTSVTNASGLATALLTPGANKANRTIFVTATSGTTTKTIQVAVVGTSLQYGGASTLQAGKTALISVTLSDSRKVGIPGVPVTISSKLNNGLSAATATTDAKGIASVTYTATNSGSDALTFTAAGATVTQAIAVSAEDFLFTSPTVATTPIAIPVSTPQMVTVTYKVGGVPQAGKTVTFSSTAGSVVPTTGTTNSLGQASTVVSSATASPATVVARIAGVSAEATLPVAFVAIVPATLVLQVTPNALPPNPAGSTAQVASLIATVKDAAGNPVQGVFVNFSRDVDPSGGNLSQPSILTDSAGQATVQYFSGASTTASSGVVLRAAVASAPGVSGVATLTVNQSALFIALGTSNVITNVTPELYKKDWVAYVTDANGVAVSNIQLTVKLLPVRYGKGILYYDGTVWTRSAPGANNATRPYYVCLNEDVNYNGQLDLSEDTNGNGILDPGEDKNGNGVLDRAEDFNGSGKLEPGNVISVSPGTLTTDSAGRAVISLVYAESYVPWVEVTLRVQAVVTGTESVKEQTFVVDGLASDFTVETIPPAGVVSPFGTGPCSSPF